jgi:hypothetical protein
MMTSERSKTFLEAAHLIHTLSTKQADHGKKEGLQMAVKELKRLASEAHEDYKKQAAQKRQEIRNYNAKAKAFGFGR